MNEEQQRVWKAIEAKLEQYGDADMRAGLAWITDEQAADIAQAAIDAAPAH